MFRDLLEYELCAAERHRRYVTLVMIHSPKDHQGLKDIMDTHVRKSDAIAHFDHSVAVLMGETDQNDALCAVDRYTELLKSHDPRFAIATYPSDDASADALIDAAQRRLDKASNGSNGNIVYQD
jgi:hypothetical protein